MMLLFNTKKEKESEMTKVKFFINLIFVFFIFILSAIFTGNSLNLYSDIASLVLGILVPYIIASFVYAPTEQSLLCREILKKGTQHDPLLLKKAAAFLNSFKKLLIYSGVVWTVMGAIGIGAHLQGPEVLGLNFGVLMIVPLYVSLILIMIVEPLKASAEKKLAGL